jgi:hypothetical protein
MVNRLIFMNGFSDRPASGVAIGAWVCPHSEVIRRFTADATSDPTGNSTLFVSRCRHPAENAGA